MKRPFLIAFVTASMLFGVTILTITPLFWSNDDVYIAMVSGGFGIASYQSPHLIFSHFLLGSILQRIPHLLGIEPFSLSIYFAVFLAVIVFNFAVLRLKTDFPAIMLLIFADVLVYLPVVARPQFTIVGALLTSAAALLALSLILRKPVTRRRLVAGLCIAALVGLYGSLIRIEAFAVIVLIAISAVFFSYLSRPKVLLTKYLPAAVLMALLILALYQLDRLPYRKDPAWGSYHTFNWLRCQFTDYNRVNYSEQTKRIFDQIGWTHNDFMMIKEWFFVHQPTYSLDNLEFIVSSFPLREQILSRIPLLSEIPGKIYASKGGAQTILALFLIFILLQRRGRLYLCAPIVSTTIVMTGLFLVGRLVPRVFLPLLSSLLLFGTVLLVFESRSLQNARKSVHLLRLAAICLVGLCAVWQASAVMTFNKKNSEAVRQVRGDITALHPRGDQLFVIWADDFPFDKAFPLLSNDPSIRQMKLFGLSSMSHAPFCRRRLEEFGIRDLASAFYERDDVFLVARPERCSLLMTFIREHFGVNTEAVKYFTGQTFTVFRLKTI